MEAYTDFSVKKTNDVWHILLLICWSLFGIISVKHKKSVYKDVIFTSLYLRHLSLMMDTLQIYKADCPRRFHHLVGVNVSSFGILVLLKYILGK